VKCSRFFLGQVHDVRQELEDFKNGMALTVDKHQHKVIALTPAAMVEFRLGMGMLQSTSNHGTRCVMRWSARSQKRGRRREGGQARWDCVVVDRRAEEATSSRWALHA